MGPLRSRRPPRPSTSSRTPCATRASALASALGACCSPTTWVRPGLGVLAGGMAGAASDQRPTCSCRAGVLEALTELDIITGACSAGRVPCRGVQHVLDQHARRWPTMALTQAGAADETHLGGASAGSLLVACHHCGLPIDTVTDACLQLARDCR